jgi:hypothetical protein
MYQLHDIAMMTQHARKPSAVATIAQEGIDSELLSSALPLVSRLGGVPPLPPAVELVATVAEPLVVELTTVAKPLAVELTTVVEAPDVELVVVDDEEDEAVVVVCGGVPVVVSGGGT